MTAPSQIEMPLAAQSYPSDTEEAASIAPVWSSRLHRPVPFSSASLVQPAQPAPDQIPPPVWPNRLPILANYHWPVPAVTDHSCPVSDRILGPATIAGPGPAVTTHPWPVSNHSSPATSICPCLDASASPMQPHPSFVEDSLLWTHLDMTPCTGWHKMDIEQIHNVYWHNTSECHMVTYTAYAILIDY